MRIIEYSSVKPEEVLYRGANVKDRALEDRVTEIIAKVRREGDAALRYYAEKFDGGAPECLEVTGEEKKAAVERVDPALYRVMEKAAENIRDFHSRQIRQGYVMAEKPGVILGQKVTPIERVGLYVPGGTAAYPSTVLMDAIPAVLAGCSQIVMVTPARAGQVPDAIIAAAQVAGVHRIFRTGGAQAVAALAYGTETVPKVDKIVGPGNAYVAEAKRQVFGAVDIDMIAGPSEILAVADLSADPRLLAADLLSQAEHDRMASAVLVTDSRDLALETEKELYRQLETLPRRDIAGDSLENNGKIIIVKDILQAVEISNEIAPEHLELCVRDPFALLPLVKNAGSVFMGHSCPEALGDYMAGPNHTLPTSGTARFSSALGVDDFVKKIQFSCFTSDALAALAPDVALFARAEGLEAHARSALSRGEGQR